MRRYDGAGPVIETTKPVFLTLLTNFPSWLIREVPTTSAPRPLIPQLATFAGRRRGAAPVLGGLGGGRVGGGLVGNLRLPDPPLDTRRKRTDNA